MWRTELEPWLTPLAMWTGLCVGLQRPSRKSPSPSACAECKAVCHVARAPTVPSLCVRKSRCCGDMRCPGAHPKHVLIGHETLEVSRPLTDFQLQYKWLMRWWNMHPHTFYIPSTTCLMTCYRNNTSDNICNKYCYILLVKMITCWHYENY